MSIPHSRYERLLTLLVLLIAGVLFLAFARPLFTGEVFVEDDHGAYQLPMMTFYDDALAEGDSFLWAPGILNGFYWHGEGQGGFAHPVVYLLYRWLPLAPAIMLHLLLSYPFMFAGAWLFLRRWQLPRSAALFGALLFTLIGINLNHYIHICFVAVFAHVFWQLYAIDRAMRGGNRNEQRAMVVLVIFLSASQLLLGCPQFTWCSWLCEGLYVLFLLPATRRYRVMIALAAAKMLSFGVAAVQVLPTADVLRFSYRENPDIEFQLMDSLHPLNLLQLLSPYLYHQRVLAMVVGDQPWDAPYLGAFTTVAMLLILLNGRRLGPWRPLAVAAFALVLLGWVSSWGRYGFIYPVYDWIPVVNKLRAPARYMALAHVGMATLGAIGFTLLAGAIRSSAPLPWRRVLPVLILPLASTALALGLTLARARIAPEAMGPFFRYLQPLPSLLAGAVLLSAAAGFVVLAARGCRPALAAIVVLTLLDIGLYSLRHKPSMPLEDYAAAVDVPADAPPGARLDPDIHSFFMNRIVVRGYRGVHGYAPMAPRRALDYTQVLPLQLSGVTHRQARLLGTPDVHTAKLAGENWIPLAGTYPRARLVPNAVVSDSPGTDIYTIDTATTALVTKPLALPGGSAGSAELQTDRPGNIRVKTEAPTRQLLVVSENYHPGWRARINGAPAETLAAYGDFLGCVVEPGPQMVEFRFDPLSWRIGKWLSGISLLAVLALWWLLRHALPGEPV